ncbi:hypothetical protein TI04_04860 [Achromatium sp. WMS2]|nr:hypothetical protein TI04_04860 [Achromatium sp. WMS2]
MYNSKFEVANVSLLGNRKVNQDRCAIFSYGDCALLLLSDGLGGHPRGEVAAQIFIDTGRTAFSDITKPISDPNAFFEEILQVSHQKILTFGRNHNPPINPKSTAVLALIQNGQVFWAHLGDSRLYLFRNNRIVMRTRDHSVVETMRYQNGEPLNPNIMRYRNLVTHCLGSSRHKPEIKTDNSMVLEPLDTLLLCTDGLWGQLSDEILETKIRTKGSLEYLAAELAQDAGRLAAPNSDNVTLIILRWLEGAFKEELPQPPRQKLILKDLTSDQNKAKKQAPKVDDPELLEALATLRSAIDELESSKKK